METVPQFISKLGYEAVGMIGEGATARVYRVVQSDIAYACKVSDISFLAPESELLSDVRHPLFPRWKEYASDGDTGYLVMELIEGSSLEEHLKRRDTFSQRETVRIALEIADGLGYLHSRQTPVIYRDLKPSNIIVQPNGHVRLTDLGATDVISGFRAGTRGYAAPEQFDDGAVSPAGDVFSLGRVMYRMLTGVDPAIGDNDLCPTGCYVADMWKGLEQIVERCTASDPGDRYQDMSSLIAALGNYHNRTDGEIRSFERHLRRRAGKSVKYTKNVWESANRPSL